MKPSLLDTDTISALFRGNMNVRQQTEVYLNTYGSLNISIINYYEILNGLFYRDAKKQLEKFNAFAAYNNILPLTVSAANIAAQLYAALRTTGEPIGHTDTLIAGVAISNNMQLITNNTEHFKRIKELEIDNWVLQ